MTYQQSITTDEFLVLIEDEHNLNPVSSSIEDFYRRYHYIVKPFLKKFKPLTYEILNSSIKTGFNNKSLKKAVKQFIDDPYEAELIYGPIKNWDVENVTNMDRLFFNGKKYDFNSDISEWNTENVTSMMGTFYMCRYFNQPLNNWNVSKVETMEEMFLFASSFNQPLYDWNVSNVKNMNRMFFRTSYSHDLKNWRIKDLDKLFTMTNT